MEFVLHNARIVGEDAAVDGAVVVRDGRIAAVDHAPSQVGEDCEGDYLIPGLIDLHTDHLEFHAQPRPGVVWPGIAAAMAHDGQVATAGITTVYDSLALMGGRKAEDRRRMLRPTIDGLNGARARGMLRVDHLLHLRCEVAEAEVLDYLDAFFDDPHVRLLSLMDHTPGQRQYAKVEAWRFYNRKAGGLSEAELDVLMEQRIEAQRIYADRHRREVAGMARLRGIPLASHDDETEAHVVESAALGVAIAEFPTTETAARACRAHGIAIMMGAPNMVRGGSHSGNIAAADLARDGLLDILASDYVPVALLHAACLVAATVPGWTLPRGIATVTSNPARAAKLDDRGRIAAGLRADLVRFRLVDGVPHIRGVWCEGRRVA